MTDANEGMIDINLENDYGFCRYIDVDDMDLLEHYCCKYDTDDLDEMVCWLNKLGYNHEHIKDIFNIEELFVAFYENYMKSIE
jgi:hypothetical protein